MKSVLMIALVTVLLPVWGTLFLFNLAWRIATNATAWWDRYTDE